MAYTTINKHTDYFNTKLYTGNGSVRTETGVGFQPDWVWIKDRDGTNAHTLTDAVRGANYQVYTNLTNAQTNASGYLTAFASDGFTLGTDGAVNANSTDYVSWNWKANGAGSSNTDGDITSTVSANTTAGFSIIKWSGVDRTGTIGHGLGAVPKMIIVKRLATRDWAVYHESVGANKKLVLNTTAAETSSTGFDDTPTSSVINVGYNDDVNGGGADYIAYCFAEKTGYSKFGSYDGNANVNGTFVYTGFKPAWVMIKNSAAAEQWRVYDSKRDSFNHMFRSLFPNANNGENTTDNTSEEIDFLSNGIKIRSSAAQLNGNNQELIYMAFGQSIVGSNNVPCTAR